MTWTRNTFLYIQAKDLDGHGASRGETESDSSLSDASH